MNNRFTGAKTLGDLYMIFSNEDIEYNHLSADELDRLADVFEANIPAKVDMPDRPLTEAGYTLVWNVTVDAVNKLPGDEMPEKDKEVLDMNDKLNINEVVEDITMTEAVEGFVEDTKEIIDDLFDDAGCTKEKVVTKGDEALTKLKTGLLKVLGVLDKGLGCSVMKDSIIDILDAGLDNGSVKSLKAMVVETERIINREIRNLEFWGDEDSFKKAVQLKALTEEARGKSIFEAFVSGVIWIWNRISRKLKSWMPDFSDKKGLLLSICRGIGKGIKKLAGYVARFAKFAVSVVTATVIWVADLIVTAIKNFVEKIKGWATVKLEAIQAKKEAAATEEIFDKSDIDLDDYFDDKDDDFDDEELNSII